MAFLQFIICVATLGCSSLVAFSRNPLNSIIFLIATFVLTTIVLLLFSIDFLSLIFIIVYVGAIAVLFLFVCMMVALKSKQENFFNFQALRKMLERVYALFFSFFIFILGFSSVFSHEDFFFDRHVIYVDHQEGIFIFGQALFNYFNISFLIAGLILLVALLGAVVLTHRFISFFRQINFSRQLSASSLGGVIGYGDSQLFLILLQFIATSLAYICGLVWFFHCLGIFDQVAETWKQFFKKVFRSLPYFRLFVKKVCFIFLSCVFGYTTGTANLSLNATILVIFVFLSLIYIWSKWKQSANKNFFWYNFYLIWALIKIFF